MKTDVARPLLVTFFKSRYAPTLETKELRLWELRDLILVTSARSKSGLRWLKLARFGNTLSENNCLRTNANVLAISGVVGEHDAGTMSFDEAIRRLRRARVTALVYTSPSATETKSRWRVVAPMSRNLQPAEHSRQMARINGVLGGALSPESFVLSQAYYFGMVGNNPAHRCEYTVCDYVDQRADLDQRARGKNSKPYVDGEPHVSGEPQADAKLVAACVAVIPNNSPDWNEWNNIGLAIWRSVGGADIGFEIFDAFSSKWKKYDARETRKRWQQFHRSPPNRIGFGTLHRLADEASPGWRAVFEAQQWDELYSFFRKRRS